MNKEIKERIETIKKGKVPDEYKRTRMGIIPNEWREVQLRNIAKAVTKKNIDNSITVTFTNSATKGVIKQTDYFEKQISNSENTSGYYVVEQDDYIYNPRISVFAPCGPINKSNFEENGIVSPLYTVFKLRNDLKKNKYIEMYLNSSFWHRYMCSVANYGARHDRMNITNNDFFRMPVPFPPLEEQEKIAEFLSRCDTVIEECEKQVEEYKNLKKTCLSKMFPKKGSNVPEIRFPGFTDAWEQCKLGNVVDVQSGKDYKHLSEGSIPVYGTGGYMLSVNKALSYNQDAIGIGRKGTIDKPYVLKAPFWTVDTLFYAIPKDDNELDFLNCIFQNVDWKKKDESTGVPSLSKSTINNVDVFVPDKKEQKSIGEYFSKLDHLITLHQRKVNAYTQMKKALTQLLLTGIVRVNKQKEILP